MTGGTHVGCMGRHQSPVLAGLLSCVLRRHGLNRRLIFFRCLLGMLGAEPRGRQWQRAGRQLPAAGPPPTSRNVQSSIKLARPDGFPAGFRIAGRHARGGLSPYRGGHCRPEQETGTHTGHARLRDGCHNRSRAPAHPFVAVRVGRCAAGLRVRASRPPVRRRPHSKMAAVAPVNSGRPPR